MNEPDVMVYLMTGFLDSGKTGFLKFTLKQDYFQIDGRFKFDLKSYLVSYSEMFVAAVQMSQLAEAVIYVYRNVAYQLPR